MKRKRKDDDFDFDEEYLKHFGIKRTPYLASLEERLVQEPDRSKEEAIRKMIHIERRKGKTPFIALDTLILSGMAGLPAPSWAWEMVDQVRKDREGGKIKSLDVVFGYSAARGRTSEVEKELRVQHRQILFVDIFKLTLLGRSVDKACEMVARRLAKERGWNKTAYDIGFRKGEDAVTDTLRKGYFKWKPAIEVDPKSEEISFKKICLDWLKMNKDEFLSRFPKVDDGTEAGP